MRFFTKCKKARLSTQIFITKQNIELFRYKIFSFMFDKQKYSST